MRRPVRAVLAEGLRMDVEQSVQFWISGLREGDPDAAQKLWERYFERLVRFAGRKLPANIRRAFDEEDVAISAFHSLCRGVRAGRFPDLEDDTNLWSLLVVITARKAQHRLRDQLAQKRGGGKVRGESVLVPAGADGSAPGLSDIIGNEPSAAFAVEVAEQSEHLLGLLPDESMRQLAVLKMEGCSNREAADALGCSLRTVERRLELIRKLWTAQIQPG